MEIIAISVIFLALLSTVSSFAKDVVAPKGEDADPKEVADETGEPLVDETEDETTETASAEETVPAEAKETDAPKFEDESVRRASLVGMTADEIAGYASDDDLQEAVYGRMTSERRSMRDQEFADFEQQKQASAKSASVRNAAPEKKAPPRIKLNPEEYDEGLVSAIETIQDQLEEVRGENKKLKAESEKQSADRQQAEATANLNRFDKLVDRVNEEYDGVFGEGSSADMKPGMKGYEERNTILNEMAMRHRGQLDLPAGRRESFDVMFEKALALSSKPKQGNVKSKARGEIAKELKKREGQVVHRSKGRTSGDTEKALTGDAKAAASVQALMKKKGIDLVEDESFD